jgi:hypothetical protein
MTEYDKRIVLNEWINKKIKYCKETSLLSENEKLSLERLINEHDREQDDFLNLIADEVAVLKRYRTSSYVYTYKQAQALIYCCNQLGLNIDIEVVFDEQEMKDILKEYNVEYKIIEELNELFMEHIKITRKK